MSEMPLYESDSCGGKCQRSLHNCNTLVADDTN